MNDHPLDLALAKVRRAEVHIEEIKGIIKAFLASGPYRLARQFNKNATEEKWVIVVDPLPQEMECAAADAIHNLRTPLDKMLAIGFCNPVLHQAEADVQKLKFPFSKNESAFTRVLKEQGKHLNEPVIQFLRSVEPYPGGKGAILATINQLDNMDKHRALLEPIKLGFAVAEIRRVAVRGGLLLRMGSQRGKHLVRSTDSTFDAGQMHQPDAALQPILRINRSPILAIPDRYLEFTAPYDDMELFTTTPGARVEAEIKPALSVAFGGATGFEGVPVIDALETMRQTVIKLLRDFEDCFFGRI